MSKVPVATVNECCTKSKKPVANAPIKKYLIEASLERKSVLLLPPLHIME